VRFFLPVFIFFCQFLSTDELKNWYIELSNDVSILEGEWSFLPEVPDAFKNIKETKKSIEVGYDTFIFGYEGAKFSGKGLRAIHPKNVESSVDSNKYFFGFNLNSKVSVKFYNTSATVRPVKTSCYQRGSLVIGFCDDADFNIYSLDPKYEILGDNIIYLSGKSLAKGVKFIYKLDSFYSDAVSIMLENKENNFHWLTPVEDIESPVILNATINGERVGDVIDELLTDLPPKIPWITNTMSLGTKKTFHLKKLNFYIKNEILYGSRTKFIGFEEYRNKINFLAELGFFVGYSGISFEAYGRLYSNFLLWEKEELYNKKSYNYFNKPFGLIGGKVVYRF